MSSYTPISCDLHSELELLAMHQTRCRLLLNDTETPCEGVIRDFKVKDRAEYLILDSGEEIRLDRIAKAVSLNSNGL